MPAVSRRALAGVGCALVALAAPAARACGVSTADGSSFCSLQEHEEETHPRWHVGASALYTSTTIDFGGGLHSDETRRSLVASLSYQPSRRTTFELALGGTLGGQLKTPTGTYDFADGPTAAVGAVWRAVDGLRSFVLVTSNLSFSAASTPSFSTAAAAPGPIHPARVGYDALDLRVGVLVGTTLFHVLSPYAVARAFGGPVYWQYEGANVTGTDAHHFQIGAGANVLVARTLGLFVEGVPLGERSLAAGGAVAF